MASSVQLRPNGLPVLSGGYWFDSASSTAIDSGDWSKLADNNDGTYIYGIMDTLDLFELDFTTYALASDQRCAGARLVSRIGGTSSGFQFHVECWLRPGGMGAGGIDNYSGTWGQWTPVWNSWYSAELPQAAIDGIRGVYRKYAGTTTPAISESYIDLDIRTRPTVSITSPTLDQRVFPQRPTISWNYDAKGDTVLSHQVKIFTNAVVLGGGFDPAASATAWDSGMVGGAANSKQVGVDLAHGGTYWAYVRMTTDFLGTHWYSSWAAIRFIVNTPPTITALGTNPATPITTTNQPSITGTYNDVDGNAAYRFQVKVFSETQAGYAGGGAIDTSPTIWDSGEHNAGAIASGGAFSIPVGAALSPNVNYKAAVRANESVSSGRWGPWTLGAAFVITTAPGVVFDPPAVPEVTGITTDQDAQRLVVTLQGRGNMLTRNQASADTGNIGMEPEANLAVAWLARDTTVTLQGGGSWKNTPAVNGVTMSMRTTRTSARGPLAVTPGRTYTALGSSRSAGTGRNARLRIRWYNAAGTYLSITDGTSSVNASGSWKSHFVTAVAPANAVWAEVLWEVTTPSEAHYWDNLYFAPGGSDAVWSRGGLAFEADGLADSFDRANSAASLGSADQGGAWTAHNGTWGIQSNRGYLVTGGGVHALASLSSPYLADGFVEADIQLSSVRASVGLMFRGLDGNNALIVRIHSSAGTDALHLYKRVAGTFTLLGSSTPSGTQLGGTYKLRVEFYGGQILVYLDGTLRISYLLLAGEHNQFGSYSRYGLYMLHEVTTNGDDLGSRWDNFRAGQLPTQRLTLQRSLDDGATWDNVRGAVNLQPPLQEAIVYDYEVPSGVLAQYRAIADAEEAGNFVASDWSKILAQLVPLAVDSWWLKDAVDPALNTRITVAPPFQFRRKESQAVFDPVGRSTSVFVSDGPKGIEGTLNVWVKDKATYDALEAILNTGRAVLLSDPLGRSWWVKFASQDWDLIRAQPQAGDTARIRHFHGLSLPFSEVAAPAVV